MIRTLSLLMLLTTAVDAETLAAARTIRAQTLLTPEDLTLVAQDVPGAMTDPKQALGMEARVMLYAGRPIRPGDIGPPAIVERNQIVRILYRNGPVIIVTEGRALARAGLGDVIRVMNLDSRTTVSGIVAADGSVHVANALQ